jgi:hypothetical protein
VADEALLEQVLGTAAGSARMAAVATEDVVGARKHLRALERDAPCWCTQAATTRHAGPRGSPPRSTSRGGRGLAKLAIEHRCPIVPVVAIGGQETALFLGQGRDMARRVRPHRLLRVKVFPAQVAPPFGLTIMDLRGRSRLLRRTAAVRELTLSAKCPIQGLISKP